MKIVVLIKKYGDAKVMILNKIIGNLSLKMNSFNDRFDNEVKTSKNIPISHFVTKEVFATKNGELGAVIKIMGVPFDVKSDEEINQLQFQLGFSIQHIGDDYSVYVTNYRHRQSSQLDGTYERGFAHDLHEEYSKQFTDADLYVNDIYITLIQNVSDTQLGKNLSFINRLKDKQSRSHQDLSNANRLKEFQTCLTKFTANLSSYTPKVLGEKCIDNKVPQAEVLRFLSILVNGQERSMTYPYHDIASFVPQRRSFFGDNTVHLQGLHERG